MEPAPSHDVPMLPTELPAPRPVSLLETDNPAAVINLVPPSLKTAIEDAFFELEHLFHCDERELFMELKRNNRMPSATDNRVRLKFWVEYDRVCSLAGGRMNMQNVIAGVCSQELWHKYLKNPYKVAWLMCVPTGYLIKAEEALEFGLEQLRDVLSISHVLSGDRVDHKLINTKLKIVQMLDLRVKGAPVQRSVHAHVSGAEAKGIIAQGAGETEESLMRQLKQLEAANRRAANLPQVKDVEAEVSQPPTAAGDSVLVKESE